MFYTFFNLQRFSTPLRLHHNIRTMSQKLIFTRRGLITHNSLKTKVNQPLRSSGNSGIDPRALFGACFFNTRSSSYQNCLWFTSIGRGHQLVKSPSWLLPHHSEWVRPLPPDISSSTRTRLFHSLLLCFMSSNYHDLSLNLGELRMDTVIIPACNKLRIMNYSFINLK